MVKWKRLKSRTCSTGPSDVVVCVVSSSEQRYSRRAEGLRSVGERRVLRQGDFWELLSGSGLIVTSIWECCCSLRSSGRFCSRSSWRTIASEETWSRRASRRSSETPSPKQMWIDCSRCGCKISFWSWHATNYIYCTYIWVFIVNTMVHNLLVFLNHGVTKEMSKC